jgi:1-Cys peroxiredoxin 6
MNLGDQFPNFQAGTTIGDIDFYEFGGDKWTILFSHPADYTPVCTTELGRAAQLFGEFEKRNVKLIALSCDSTESHLGWIKDIQAYNNLEGDFPFPIIDDESRELAVKLNMLDKDEIGSKGLPLTCRAVFIIDGNKKLRASLLYPASSGRNFEEIIRLVDSMQLTDRNKVATPVDWTKGTYCMVVPSVTNDDIPKLYPKGVEHVQVPSGKSYIRKTPCPE